MTDADSPARPAKRSRVRTVRPHRVGRAARAHTAGYLVRLHCENAGLKEVPEPLSFRWQPGRGIHNRNPSDSSLRFRQLNASAPRQWAECNVQAAWILGALAREGRFGTLPRCRRLRALEAALFMIGYELPTPE